MYHSSYYQSSDAKRGHNPEDYIVSGETENFIYVIGADGCGSSKKAFIGSILIVERFEEYIKDNFVSNIEDYLNSVILENFDINHLNDYLSTFYCLLYNKESGLCNVFLRGDGAVFFKDSFGINVVEVDFSMDAPYYAHYEINEDLNKLYLSRFEGQVVTESLYRNGVLMDTFSSGISNYFPFSCIFNLSELEFLGICSDGYKKISDMDFSKMLDFNNNFGDFFKRRVKAYVKDRELLDDISFGFISAL